MSWCVDKYHNGDMIQPIATHKPESSVSTSKYRISKEENDWVVSIRKTGLIIAYLNTREDAADYLAAQERADEQSRVMREFNDAEELHCLVSELREELTAI